MAYDPTQSYVINTSALPVYVLPPEQYTQINQQQQFVQPYPDQAVLTQPYGQPTYTQVGVPYGQPVAQPYYAQNPYATQPPVQTISQPAYNATKAARIEQSLLARGDQVPGICDSINGAFRLFGKYCGSYVLWTLSFLGVLSGYITMCIFGYSNRYPDPTLLSLGQLAFNFIILAFFQGLYYATIQVSRSDSAEMKVSYWVTPLRLPFFIKLLLLNLIITLIMCLGFIFLIFPGIYFAVCYMFSMLLFHEYEPHGLSITQCMNISKTVVGKHFCFWWGFAIVCGLVSFIPFCFPVSMIALVLAFRDTFGLIEQHDVGDLNSAL